MIKTYKCPVHGEFEHECNINDGELRMCPKPAEIFLVDDIPKDIIDKFKEMCECKQPVTRVYKPTHYSWKTDGFCGRGFD